MYWGLLSVGVFGAIGVNRCGAYQVWAVGGFVRHHGRGLAGQGGRGTAAGVDPLLLLPAVAEPDAMF